MKHWSNMFKFFLILLKSQIFCWFFSSYLIHVVDFRNWGFPFIKNHANQLHCEKDDHYFSVFYCKVIYTLEPHEESIPFLIDSIALTWKCRSSASFFEIFMFFKFLCVKWLVRGALDILTRKWLRYLSRNSNSKS